MALWPPLAITEEVLNMQAVRNFVQLCLEGYYDKTPFFRIDKGFMAQAGDPSGTGRGGESVYGHPFNDEFHSRLKFNHRSAFSTPFHAKECLLPLGRVGSLCLSVPDQGSLRYRRSPLRAIL